MSFFNGAVDIQILSLTVALLVAFIDETNCLKCFECEEVLSARECKTVAHCSTGQACFNERYINSNGHVYRRLGCRDINRCPGSILGRRKRSSASSEITICEKCCDSDFCQPKVCDDIDFPVDRGHICYGCDQQSGASTCDTVKECSRDDVCYESSGAFVMGSPSRTTGCMPRSVLEDIKKLNFTSSNYTENWTDSHGVHHIQSKCFACCDKDTCNTQCAIEVPCHDTSVPSLCQSISQYVCNDKTKATNSGCLKFCGFCH